MSSYFTGLTVLAGFTNYLSWFWEFIYRSCHRFLYSTVVEYENSTEHLFMPHHLLVPVTSVCYCLCITLTLQRRQGEIVNYLHRLLVYQQERYLEISAKQTVELSIPPHSPVCLMVLGHSRATGRRWDRCCSATSNGRQHLY